MFYYFSYKYWVVFVISYQVHSVRKKIDWKENENFVGAHVFVLRSHVLKFDYKRDCNGLGPNKKRNHMSITQNMMKKAELFLKFS